MYMGLVKRAVAYSGKDFDCHEECRRLGAGRVQALRNCLVEGEQKSG